jgi:hypothetical protein
MIANIMPIPAEKICDCLRCGHAWVKRIDGRPEHCPKCKQPHWDTVSKGRGRPPKKKAGVKKAKLAKGKKGR